VYRSATGGVARPTPPHWRIGSAAGPAAGKVGCFSACGAPLPHDRTQRPASRRFEAAAPHPQCAVASGQHLKKGAAPEARGVVAGALSWGGGIEAAATVGSGRRW
jgi:hypothetical protein